MLSLANTSYAVKRWGKISNSVHYDRLVIDQLPKNKCKVTLEIENKSRKLLSTFTFRMTAFDIHKSVEWTKKIRVTSIQAGDDKKVSKTIKGCKEDNPYKIVFSH